MVRINRSTKSTSGPVPPTHTSARWRGRDRIRHRCVRDGLRHPSDQPGNSSARVEPGSGHWRRVIPTWPRWRLQRIWVPDAAYATVISCHPQPVRIADLLSSEVLIRGTRWREALTGFSDVTDAVFAVATSFSSDGWRRSAERPERRRHWRTWWAEKSSGDIPSAKFILAAGASGTVRVQSALHKVVCLRH
jgi:hypothetical protein